MVEQSYSYNSNPSQHSGLSKTYLRWIIIIIALIIIMVIAFILSSNFSSGEIVVNTNDSRNTITVAKVLSDNQTKSDSYSAQNNGHLSTSLPTGTYTVTVQNRYFSADQTVSIKSGHTTTVNLNLDKLSYLEPVASLGTHDLLASNNQLEYINLSDNHLYTIDQNNNLNNINSSYTFQNIEWASNGIGIAQESNGQLFVVSGSNITPLNLGLVPQSPNTLFSVSPSGTVYIATNYALYKGSATGNFTKIYSLADPDPYIVAGNQAVAVFEGGSEGVSKAAGKTIGSQIHTISNSGAVYTLDDGAYEAAWSPNGQYLVTTDDGGTYVYNSALKKLYTVPNKNVNTPVWLDNNTIFYGVSGALWEYNLHTQQAHIVSSSALNGTVSEISPSTDGTYVYVLTSSQVVGAPVYQLSRFGLQGQATSTNLGELQVYLPNTVGGCGLNYVDFKSLSILVLGINSQQQNCINQAQTYLNSYDVNTSGLTFKFLAQPSTE